MENVDLGALALKEANVDEKALANQAAQEIQLATPGQPLTSSKAFMRGHGTFIQQATVVSSLAGVVERINKLVTVRALKARYAGEIGDVVVGRITGLGTKRWHVDLNARQDGNLLLSAINLPGGVQRRKSESDELRMRTFFTEGDLLVAEIQSLFHDGSISLHTRNLKYGKLRNGTLVRIPPALVQRSRSHFHTIPCGVDVILGLNGYIWVSKHIPPEVVEANPEEVYSNRNDPDITDEERTNVARVVNCIIALSRQFIHIHETAIVYAFEASLTYPLKDITTDRVASEIGLEVRSKLQA
ncbi:Exosome complex component rrp4 [Tieghemiomyces parasiticus]|uniref:Exosome complex component rrp4 n=1 Tax=Tieghemiomyces parasiticus TaxID=78921 RepID=A0A9W8DNJ0_9FUNG|nr:Exosome complex component rrp4 [Tieghemiomyces parasiticus]